ncbi:MAG: tetratricopeptide repeat protein [Proteobacteria bacterium]|nr:tetratricopeptide repeat protein [Pseudomonadota bacterium]
MPLPKTEEPEPPPELATQLAQLGEGALERGELAVAQDRFRRALSAHPRSVRARIGLARVALARGEPAEARTRFEAALALDPSSADALIGLAGLEPPERARALLSRAVLAEPTRPDAHAALAALTGPAGSRAIDPAEAIALATAHPYDPRAALAAARVLLASGRAAAARVRLAAAVWLADLDPQAGLEAARLLREIDPAHSERRIVQVHCYADESIRRQPGWQMRLRLIWHGLSTTLTPALDTTFVPVSIGAFSSAGAGAQLGSIEAAFLTSVPRVPPSGIVAVFSGQPPPRRKGHWRLGAAEFLGRRLMTRLGEDGLDTKSRTLVHEVLHLYGGVHIAADRDSLMNPSGDSLQLDPANERIVSLMRARRFGPGGLDGNLRPTVDAKALTIAYVAALRQNLTSRALGLAEALEARETSRFVAADLARDAVVLDEHMASVCLFVGQLLIWQARFGEAAHFFDFAARLYGSQSRLARQAAAQARALRRAAGVSPAPSPRSPGPR